MQILIFGFQDNTGVPSSTHQVWSSTKSHDGDKTSLPTPYGPDDNVYKSTALLVDGDKHDSSQFVPIIILFVLLTSLLAKGVNDINSNTISMLEAQKQTLPRYVVNSSQFQKSTSFALLFAK